MRLILRVLGFGVVATACRGTEPVQVAAACSGAPIMWENDVSALTTISEGVSGAVWVYTGDCMPSVGPSSCCLRAAARMIYAFPRTTVDQATSVYSTGPYYTSFGVAPVDSALAGENGFFQMPLPPGRYSFAARDDGYLYANLYDAEWAIQPADIESGAVAMRMIRITKAAF